MAGQQLQTPHLAALAAGPSTSAASKQEDLDTRVRKFLDANRGQWRDLNVPAVDGQSLHDIIVKHKYTRALEIGTSTGPPSSSVTRNERLK